MKEVLELIIKNLVENKDAVSVSESMDKNITIFNVKVDSKDMGRVIGKEGKGVNGIYNQDISPYSILIETGGQYNNIAEVTNTMEILASVLKEYIEENPKWKRKKNQIGVFVY